jgi:hypothetical protein
MSNAIYRYTFMKTCTDKLGEFVEIHQHEERLDFKKSWKEWINVNNDLIISETNRLKTDGYEGNVIDKMFISVRFYLKKNLLNKPDIDIIKPESLIETKAVKHTSNEIIEIINEHIRLNILKFSPLNLFNDFNIKHKNELMNVGDLKKQKKIYKNRYYIIKKSMA